MSEPKYGTFHDALTGETITRELTPEETPAPSEPTPLITEPSDE